MSRNIYLIGTIFFSALIMGCSGKDGNSAFEKEIPVKTLSVNVLSIERQQNYVGTVEETFSSSLSFEVAGNVSNIYIREGEKVNKGQLIASLDKVTLQDNYDVALSTLKQAEDTYNRLKVLHENKSLPEIKWIEVQTSLQQAKSMENIAKKNLKDCSLYAPFAGVITERSTEAGTNVMPGIPAFKLVTIDKVKIKIAVPEKEINNTHIGQMATIRIAALNNKQLQGKISEKNVTANPLSHTYEVKIALDNPAGELMPGMVCNVNVNQEEKSEKKIIVPSNAVQINHIGENFVWLAVNAQAQKRIVQTGGFSGNNIIISEGLSNGEKVIIEGNQKISEGMKIIIR